MFVVEWQKEQYKVKLVLTFPPHVCCSSCLRAADTCLHCWGGQVTTMRQDLANRFLWERRTKVVGTLLPSFSFSRSLPLSSLWRLYTALPGKLTQVKGGASNLMNTKQNLLPTGELQKSSVFNLLLFFFFPLFHSWHWALHQPILALFRKERKEREKQNRAKVWELFLLPLFQSEWFHCC